MKLTFLVAYLAILALHAGWAWILMNRKLASLAIGPIDKPWLIMLGLFILNLPSVIVFVPNTGLAGTSVALPVGHGLYHILLMIDEVFRTGREPVRGLFLANHLAWACLLFAFASTQ